MNAPSLAASYAAADAVAKAAAKNFYPCFKILPRPQRDATVALYAFLRAIDDVADGDLPLEEKQNRLAEWKRAVDGIHLRASLSDVSWGPAFADVVQRFNLPLRLLHDAIDGVAWDLDPSSCRHFSDLYEYCYGVASTAGLLSIRIWGAADPNADLPAEWLGVAFQLTNILRDVGEDRRDGRCYLPTDDLARFGVLPEDFLGDDERRFTNLIRFEAARADDYFTRGLPVADFLPGPGRAVVAALSYVYRSLLHRIAADPLAVLKRRISAPCSTKLWALLRALPLRFLNFPPPAAGEGRVGG